MFPEGSRSMRKIISLNIITIIVLVLLFSAGCYLLLQENRLHASIASIIANSDHVNLKKHLLVLGLLPIYIAAIVFGTALLGIYLGSRVQQSLNHFLTIFCQKSASCGKKKLI